jgi:arsenite methyltransferase
LDCFLAAQKVGPKGKVIGIDMTPEMLDLAQKNASKKGFSNVTFIKGDIEQIPLPDNTADVVISNCVINLVPDKNKAFREIYRILKPGGRVAVSDIVLKKPLPPRFKDTIEAYVGCISGALPIKEVSDTMNTVGFHDVQVVDSKADLNVYSKLAGTDGGERYTCCGSGATGDIAELLKEVDANEYAASAKITAWK